MIELTEEQEKRVLFLANAAGNQWEIAKVRNAFREGMEAGLAMAAAKKEES